MIQMRRRAARHDLRCAATLGIITSFMVRDAVEAGQCRIPPLGDPTQQYNAVTLWNDGYTDNDPEAISDMKAMATGCRSMTIADMCVDGKVTPRKTAHPGEQLQISFSYRSLGWPSICRYCAQLKLRPFKL